MLWSVLNECVACTQILGMWHSMQPLDELTGQAGFAFTAFEWQARHLASLRSADDLGVLVRIVAGHAIEPSAALGRAPAS